MSAGTGQLKTEVQTFWNRQTCETAAIRAPKFSREYFDQIEERRYAEQPYIHSFAQFSRYYGKRVLEVGFGAGTDFIQWLRAGAVVSGIDLTEEALAHLSHRIQVYGLPKPESMQVADAENLPFASDSFDLGYSWGVLHHTPDTRKALAELVRVVRPGGEIKVMLYNRHSLYAYQCWLNYALLRGRPWKSFSSVLWNHVESIGTKAYTQGEVQQILKELGLDDAQMETYVVSHERSARKALTFLLYPVFVRLAMALVGNKCGWYRTIAARKPKS